MTSDPFQIFIMILVISAFPFIAWASGRITELMVAGEDERVPENLKWLVGEEYIEAIRQGKRKYKKWKLGVVVIGLGLPTIMLCSATAESLIPRLIVILASGMVFLMGVALLEWLVRPRSG